MNNGNNQVAKYTKEQSKVISAYFSRMVALFIVAVIFLLASIIITFSKDFLSLKTNEPMLLLIIILSTLFIGLTCMFLMIVNYKQMKKYIEKADKQNNG